MSLGISATAWAGLGTAAVGAYGASQNASAAAGDTHTANVWAMVNAMQALADKEAQQNRLNPYINAGEAAVGQQGNLLGLNGNSAQQAAINSLRGSPAFTAMLKEGENSILQNASATGGLRGGNVQAALAKFSPMLLASTINDRLGQFGGLAAAGQNASLGMGTLAAQTNANQATITANLMAGNRDSTKALIEANNGMVNTISSGLGMWAGLGTKAREI